MRCAEPLRSKGYTSSLLKKLSGTTVVREYTIQGFGIALKGLDPAQRCGLEQAFG